MSGLNNTTRLKAMRPGLRREITLQDHRIGLNIRT